MNRSALSLEQRLDVELAEKTPAASAAFFTAAVVFLFGKFTGLNETVTQIATILVMIVNIGRVIVARSMIHSGTYHPRHPLLLKTFISLNSVFWGVLFLPTYDVLASGPIEGGFLLLTVTAMAAGSVITLSSSRAMALFCQWCLLVPSCIIAWNHYFTLMDRSHLGFASLYMIFILFLNKQSLSSHNQLVRSFTHEINLENSLEDLRKSNERIVEETAKSQHASRLAAIGEIAGGIAHEVNNPLTVVLSSIEHLENIYQDDRELFDKTFLTKTARSKTAIERINRIIRGLRVFSQQSDRQPKKWVNLKQILDDTIEFCGEKMSHNGIAYTISLHSPDTKIFCNPVQISQVLLNLLNNSIYVLSKIQASDERWIKIETTEYENVISVSVTDSGLGIAPEHQKKLFQPFFTTKELGEGTGLGLSISQSILREHGGDLRFDPHSTHTRFVFTLPIEGK